MPTLVGTRVKISARNCNYNMIDSKNWFDSGAVLRMFELDLSSPFERAIAVFLTYLVPNHQTYIVANGEYFDPETKAWMNLQMKEMVDADYMPRLEDNPGQLKLIEGLRRILDAATEVDKAVELFQEVDVDGSGQLDEGEFGELLQAIGKSLSL